MVRNVSKNGERIKDISKITVPINNKTIRAYEMLARGNKSGSRKAV